jgi:hypothetical protein
MARTQFDFTVAEPDEDDALVVMAGALVEVLYRDPDYTVDTDYTTPKPDIYTAEDGEDTEPDNVLIADASGKVSGWLEDGRYRLKVTAGTSTLTTSFTRDIDVRSGGQIKVAAGGNPVAPTESQIVLADDFDGTNPSIRLGPGDDVPDVEITRSDPNQITFDTVTPGSLETIIRGDVILSSSDKSLSANGARIQEVATPFATNDAANKGYVDASNNISDSSFYLGKIHNIPLYRDMGDITLPSANKFYFTKVEIPMGTIITSIDFVRGTGSSATVDTQFGLFAEFNDLSGVQTITLTGTPTGGNFTISWDGEGPTTAIAYNAAAATVQTALETLANVDTGDIVVTGSAGGPWTLTWANDYANIDVPLVTCNSAGLTGGTTPTAVPASSNERHMDCLISTSVGTGAWAAGSTKSLPVGSFTGITHTPEPFYVGPSLLTGNHTGILYAGIVVSTLTNVNLVGASVTSPVVTADLGLSASEQFPFFAGGTADTTSISTSVFVESGDELTFPAARGADVPFCRIAV